MSSWWNGSSVLIGGTMPAHPGAFGGGHDGSQRGDEPAGGAPPAVVGVFLETLSTGRRLETTMKSELPVGGGRFADGFFWHVQLLG